MTGIPIFVGRLLQRGSSARRPCRGPTSALTLGIATLLAALTLPATAMTPQDDGDPGPIVLPQLADRPPSVRGLDLSKVPVRSSREAYRSTPDLYVRDAADPESWTHPKNVFQMPLAEDTWLKYPAGSGHFYIEHRHEGLPQNEQLYGPIEGDPFEVLKLGELFTEQLQPGATGGDPRYRLRLMLRTGEPGLVRRAWDLIEPQLAPGFMKNTERVYDKLELLEGVRAVQREHAAAFRHPALRVVVERIRRRLADAEAEIDRVNDSVPDEGYQSGTYLQPKIAAKIPDALWGRPVDGLRLALVPRDWVPGLDWNELPAETPIAASTTVRPGDEQNYQLVVENVSDRDIKLSGIFQGEEHDRILELSDRAGKPVALSTVHTTIPRFRAYWRLKPGERHLLTMPALHFIAAEPREGEHRLGYSAKADPGEYTVQARIRFGHYDNQRHRHVPGKSEWIGELATGTQKVTVSGPAPAADKQDRPPAAGKADASPQARRIRTEWVPSRIDNLGISLEVETIEGRNGAKVRLADDVIDRLLFGNASFTFTAETAPTRAESLATARLVMLDRVCGLSDEQKQRLKLAAQGDVRRYFTDVEEVRSQLREFAPIQDDGDASLAAWIDREAKRISDSTRPFRVLNDAGPFGAESLLAKTTATILTREQAARYEHFREALLAGGGVIMHPARPQRVQLVYLDDRGINDQGLTGLASVTEIETLYLARTSVTDDGLAHMSRMSGLKSVFLSGTTVTGAGLAKLASLPALESLDVSSTRLSDDDLAPIGRLKGLTSLHLHQTAITDAGLKHLAGLSKLKSLDLSNTRVTETGLVHLRGLVGLETLRLPEFPFTDAGLPHLAGLVRLTQFKVHGTEITDVGLSHLSEMTHLKSLDVRDSRVTDAGLSHLRGKTGLTHLVLSRTRVTDEGLKNLENLPSLWSLQLDGTGVTDAGLRSLYGCRNLETVHVEQTAITAAGASGLMQAVKYCQVHR